ncbi:MAG: TRAP transporter small permease subunit [Acidimicrobiales bacterium]|nr:TRAP transporter small permease subunit [Acidimicrobiales bacterium]
MREQDSVDNRCGHLGFATHDGTGNVGLTNPVDVEEVLEHITHAERRELVTEGLDGIRGRVHPLGWVALGLFVLGLFFTFATDTDLLLGNMAWWHWLLIVGLGAASLNFTVLDRVRAGIEKLSDFAIDGVGVDVVRGSTASLVVGLLAMVIFSFTHDIEVGITSGFGFALLVGSILMGPVWVLTWGVFMLALYSSLTRYIARFVERDLIIAEISAMSWQVFALIALLGVGYGVREAINPRIDFWWAEFSNRRKALLDFVLHVTLFLPFLIAALRILQPYAKISLGFKRDFSGETDGSWPSGWRVWETWEQQGDAGQLPTGPIQAMIFVAFVLFFLQVLADAIKHGFTLIHREDLGQVPEHDAPMRVE